MAFASFLGGLRHRPGVTMAALGLVSGAVSVRLGMGRPADLAWLEPLATVLGIGPEPLPVLLVGLYFSIAMALGIWLHTASLLALPAVLVTTMCGWGAAIPLAVTLQRTADDDPHLIAASLAAGAVGAGITHLGCAMFSPALRRPARIALTIIVGALAGMLYFAGRRNFVDEWLLFLVWQPTVAFCIGLGLGRGQARRV